MILHISPIGIAKVLLCETRKRAAELIIPPWMNDDCDAFNDAWSQVQTLRRQRDELIAIWPHKRAELEAQFEDAVLKVASVFEEKCGVDE